MFIKYDFLSPVSFSILSLIFTAVLTRFSNGLNFCDDKFSSSFNRSIPPLQICLPISQCSGVVIPTFGFGTDNSKGRFFTLKIFLIPSMPNCGPGKLSLILAGHLMSSIRRPSTAFMPKTLPAMDARICDMFHGSKWSCGYAIFVQYDVGDSCVTKYTVPATFFTCEYSDPFTVLAHVPTLLSDATAPMAFSFFTPLGIFTLKDTSKSVLLGLYFVFMKSS